MILRPRPATRAPLLRAALAVLAAAPLAAAAQSPAAPAGAEQADEPELQVHFETTLGDERDLLQLFGFRATPPPEPEPGHVMLFALPAFGVNPTVGFALGAAINAAVALGPVESTTVSSFSASAMYTTKNQFISTLKSILLTRGNTWELLGDARYQRFGHDTYGLGTGDRPVEGSFHLNGLETTLAPGAQPIRYSYLKLHETVLRRVQGHAYAGLGYHLDSHWDIEDEAYDPSATPVVLSSHEAYSRTQGFDPDGYSTSGLSLDALYESRDHTLDPYSGTYALLTWRANPTWLGSSQPSTMLYVELRRYFSLSALRKRHLLAVWAYVSAVTSGKVPYLDLPAVGYDNRDRSGRGYPQGRFRGTALAYGEIEYRFPISRGGLVSGVLFANGTTAARPPVSVPEAGIDDRGISLFEEVEPGGGAGLRIRADRQARMSLVVDLAFGKGGSSGLYLSMGETF